MNGSGSNTNDYFIVASPINSKKYKTFYGDVMLFKEGNCFTARSTKDYSLLLVSGSKKGIIDWAVNNDPDKP